MANRKLRPYDPLPVLLARVDPDRERCWLVWCPYCAKEHGHGGEAGHRQAHCIAGPFRDQGYYIALPGSAYLRQLQRRRSVPVVNSGGVVLMANGAKFAAPRVDV